MFTDEDLDPVEFKSCWKKERYTDEIGVQTKDLRIEEAGVQSKYYEDEETQTENSRDNYLQLAETDMSKLAKFLSKVEPEISRILDQNMKSLAFDEYTVRTSDDDVAVSCTHTLCHAELKNELQVTGISWNSTGSVVAATFGRFDHEDWCTHKAALCTWSIDRRNVSSDKPNTVIDTSSCLMCLQFHPTNPAWIVGGNFNGEVMVWDLNKEDDLLISTSGIGDDAHREPVAKVEWIRDTSSKSRQYNIISVGGDGKILIWTMSKKKPKLKLVDGFVLMTQSLPRSMKVRGVRGDKEIGATSISFNLEDKDNFIVGSESGCIFKCNLQAQGNPAGSHIISSVPLRSPVAFTFNPHHGPVHSVHYSPFHRNAFLTSGMDQCIRIYNVLQDQPAITVEPGEGYLYSARWSPVRPTLLAAVTEKGNLLLYDLKSDQLAPLHKIEASLDNTPVYSLQFNTSRRNLLATGDGKGYIRVFKLGDDLATPSSRDLDHLVRAINTTD